MTLTFGYLFRIDVDGMISLPRLWAAAVGAAAAAAPLFHLPALHQPAFHQPATPHVDDISLEPGCRAKLVCNTATQEVRKKPSFVSLEHSFRQHQKQRNNTNLIT